MWKRNGGRVKLLVFLFFTFRSLTDINETFSCCSRCCSSFKHRAFKPLPCICLKNTHKDTNTKSGMWLRKSKVTNKWGLIRFHTNVSLEALRSHSLKSPPLYNPPPGSKQHTNKTEHVNLDTTNTFNIWHTRISNLWFIFNQRSIWRTLVVLVSQKRSLHAEIKWGQSWAQSEIFWSKNESEQNMQQPIPTLIRARATKLKSPRKWIKEAANRHASMKNM